MTAVMFISFSVLPTLSLTEGILHCDIIEGAFDSETFYTFIDRLLDWMQPYPAPNSVIIMDNCRIHKAEAILELIESRWVSYLQTFNCSNLQSPTAGCIMNFCHHIHLTSIPSSWHSLPWNIITYVEMVNTSTSPWHIWLPMTSIAHFWKRHFKYRQRMYLVGSDIVATVCMRTLYCMHFFMCWESGRVRAERGSNAVFLLLPSMPLDEAAWVWLVGSVGAYSILY